MAGSARKCILHIWAKWTVKNLGKRRAAESPAPAISAGNPIPAVLPATASSLIAILWHENTVRDEIVNFRAG
jgi:hypothetical protein